MRARTDRQLLAAYAAAGDAAAFAEIVERHSAKVFAACLDVLGDRHEAEDAAQAAFLVLVRKARRLSRGTVLSGWLFLTARNAARDALKKRARRARREKEAGEMKAMSDVPKPSPNIEGLHPALAALPAAQRDALLLRYVYGLSQERAAQEVGCPPQTLHSRVTAGLARLRRKLGRAGDALPAAALAGLLGQCAAVEAPAGLAAGIKAACLGGAAASTAALSIAEGTMKAMTFAKVKIAAAVLGTAAVLGGGGVAVVNRLVAAESVAAPKRAATIPAGPKVATQKVAAIPAGARMILGQGSPWRRYVHLRKPVVPAKPPKVLPIRKLHGGRPTPRIQHLENLPAPARWTHAGFDDSDWPRSRGNLLKAPHVTTGMLCLRGRFTVLDPAAVTGLYLSMKFRGGAVVYLNGREVARAYLPKEKVYSDTPGEAYPDAAWVDAAGKMLHLPDKVKKAEDKARMAKRDRVLGPLQIPASALRKGVNVLAVELHRSDYHPVALRWWQSKNLHYGLVKSWAPVGLLDVRLAAAGSGAAPNLLRPEGTKVWNADIHGAVFDIPWGEPGAKLLPIRIVGARGGVFSGQVVVSSDKPLVGVKAGVGDLTAKKGGAKIPASAVEVRYVSEGNINHQDRHGRRVIAFNVLDEKALAEVKPSVKLYHWHQKKVRTAMGLPAEPLPAAAQPVMVIVKVPRDAAAGEYRGKLTVSAGGLAATEVPVHLTVAGWAVPKPLEFRTHAGVFQSPTTLALTYKVPEWSEEHWKLMEKSFEMLAEVGNDLVNIPVSNQTQFGNDEGMVWWVRKADGGYEYDFKVFDRYIKLVKKHLGVPRYVALHVWHAGAWKTKPANEKNEVTVIDQKTGKRQAVQVPVFGTPESKKFWTPVLTEIKKRLAREGMEKSICLGVLSDGTAPPAVFKMFREILPEAGWTRGCHSTTFSDKPYGLKGGGKCVYHEFCYGLGLSDPAVKFPRIWAMTGPGAAWFRGEKDYRLPPFIYRTIPERGLYCGTSGVGRLGLDLWSVPFKSKKGKPEHYVLFNRWPHSSVAGHGDPTLVGLAHAGKAGPQRTVRFQLFREGLQEAEALIFIGEAQEKHKDKLGAELAAECRALLVERINVCRMTQGITERFYAGWQDRSARLYAAAAKVAQKLGKK